MEAASEPETVEIPLETFTRSKPDSNKLIKLVLSAALIAIAIAFAISLADVKPLTAALIFVTMSS